MAATELTLYATPISVYCCKLRLALALKGLYLPEIAPPDGYVSAAYRAIVPQGTIPALVHDGFVLAESDAIVEYLDEIGAGQPLMPQDPRERARSRALSRFIDMRLEPSVRALFPLVGAGKPVPDPTRAALLRQIETLERLAGDGPYLAGGQPGLPDCGLWAVAIVLEAAGGALALGLPRPSGAGAGDGVPACAPLMAEYRAQMAAWVTSKGGIS
jgi:glutathione S-transferase